MNVVLFVPAGFLFALTRSAAEGDAASRPAQRRTLLWTGTLGVLVSAAIEIVQQFEPTRFSSPTDVATNAAGALLGAWLHGRAARRLEADSPLVGRLALELPLVGLLYLMLPLLTLAALTVRGGHAVAGWPAMAPAPREWGLFALALFGGTILGHVQRRHLAPSRALTARQAALVAAGWFVVGALPALATAPGALVGGALIAAIAAWAHGRTDEGVSPINRRFELQTLGRAVSWLAAYLALVPLTDPPAAPAFIGAIDVLRRVESIAGLTIFGYVLAEAWGRHEMRYRVVGWRVLVVALLAAASAEVLRRVAVPTLPSVPSLLAHGLAAAYGGWIYHLQRAHVRALIVARRAAAGPAPTARPTPSVAGTPGGSGAPARVYAFPTPGPVRAVPRATSPAPDARSGAAIRRPK
jgi:hypothetical protein